MKTCLIIIGRLDTFEHCYLSLKKHVLDHFKPDIFFSGHPNKNGIDYCDAKMKELWNPTSYLLREYTDEVRKEAHPNDSRFDSNKISPNQHTWLSGMHNLKLANRLKTQHETQNGFQYDICIKSRTDAIWHSYVTDEELELAKIENNILIPTAWDFKCVHPSGMSDVSCVTGSDGMNRYASCIDHIDQYFDAGTVFHPETMLGTHVNKIGLNRIPITSGVDQSGWCVIDPNPNRKMI